MQDEVHGITLLALRQILAFVHVEQLNFLEQFLLRLRGHGHNILKQHFLIEQQSEVATNGRELAYLLKFYVFLACQLNKGSPIQVGKEHFVRQTKVLANAIGHISQFGNNLSAPVHHFKGVSKDVVIALFVNQ